MQSVRNRLSENDTKFIFRIICCPYKAPQPLLEVAFFTWLWPLLVFFCEYLILPLFYKCECVSGKKVLYKSLFCGSFCWVKYRNWNIAITSFPLGKKWRIFRSLILWLLFILWHLRNFLCLTGCDLIFHINLSVVVWDAFIWFSSNRKRKCKCSQFLRNHLMVPNRARELR